MKDRKFSNKQCILWNQQTLKYRKLSYVTLETTNNMNNKYQISIDESSKSSFFSLVQPISFQGQYSTHLQMTTTNLKFKVNGIDEC